MRRLYSARGHAHAPHFYKWMGTGGTVRRRTPNKKLTKLYWPSQKRSPERLIVLLEPKKWSGTTKKMFRRIGPPPHFRSGPVPHFQIRSGSTGYGHVRKIDSHCCKIRKMWRTCCLRWTSKIETPAKARAPSAVALCAHPTFWHSDAPDPIPVISKNITALSLMQTSFHFRTPYSYASSAKKNAQKHCVNLQASHWHKSS